MSSLLLLTNALQPSAEVLPALGLLLHSVRVAPAEGSALVDTPSADVILVDGRRDLPHIRSLCQLLRSTGPGAPVVLVVTEGGLAAVTADWGIDDVLLDTAGPAEVEARLRLAMGRAQVVQDDSPMEIRNGDLSVDEATYSARLKGRVLDLTFKEFELIKYLAQHPEKMQDLAPRYPGHRNAALGSAPSVPVGALSITIGFIGYVGRAPQMRNLLLDFGGVRQIWMPLE